MTTQQLAVTTTGIQLVLFGVMYMWGSRARGQKVANARLGGISNLGASEILMCGLASIIFVSVISMWITISTDPFVNMIVIYAMLTIASTWSQRVLGAIGIEIAEFAFATSSQVVGLFLISKVPLLQRGLAWLLSMLGI